MIGARSTEVAIRSVCDALVSYILEHRGLQMEYDITHRSDYYNVHFYGPNGFCWVMFSSDHVSYAVWDSTSAIVEYGQPDLIDKLFNGVVKFIDGCSSETRSTEWPGSFRAAGDKSLYGHTFLSSHDKH